MCGIAGVIVFEGKPVKPAVIHAMTEALAHRGPNDSGCEFFNEGHAALGHRRLSIIDISPLGHQPMASADGNHWIVFNGEVYNYVELRAELERAGRTFRSHTDTEVILQAYLQWGPACFSRFNGMWALAIYNRTSRELVLSRDRFGKKPLYYYFDGKILVFGSEPKAIFAHPSVTKSPDLRKIVNYAGRHYRYVEDDRRSFFEGIAQVPKGQVFSVDGQGKVGSLTYWSLRPAEDLTVKFSEPALVEQFRDLLDDAVRLRLRSDVPVGAMLSGGMDSTSIVSLAARRHPHFKTFSSVTGEGYYDESAYIHEVVKAAGVEATFIYPAAENLFTTLREMLKFHDEPVCTVTWYSMYLMVKEIAKANVPVVLTGHGGDELLAGYWDHYHYHFQDIRTSGADDASERGSWLDNHRREASEYAQQRMYVEALAKDGAVQTAKFSTYLGCLQGNVQALAMEPERGNPFHAALDRRLYSELFYESVPASLRAEDRNCMAFSIENRVPFLDYRLVEFAFRLPSKYKIRDGLGKWILREAMKGILPEKVRTRKDKAGHNMPFDEWLRGPNRAEVEMLLCKDGFINETVYVRRKVEALFREHLNGSNHQMFFWQYINLHLWYEHHFQYNA